MELDEVERRRKLVDDVGREIEEMRQELKRTVVMQQAGPAGGGDVSKNVSGGGALPNPSHFDNLLGDDGERDEDYYSEMENQRQVEMMHEQDQQLDGVFRTVGNLRQQADDMGRELEEQSEMIKDVDNLADRVGGKLQNGVKRVGHMIKRNEGRSCSSHSILCVVLSDQYANGRRIRHHVKLLHCDFDNGPHHLINSRYNDLVIYKPPPPQLDYVF